MIVIKRGDIFLSKTLALVNPVNCVGVCGAGLAKEFRTKFPTNYDAYKSFCDRKGLFPGRIFPVAIPFKRVTIINFATKDHWQNPSELQWVERGMEDLLKYMYESHLHSVAIPALGCGKGGLAWTSVRRIIVDALMAYEEYAGERETIFEIYEPAFY